VQSVICGSQGATCVRSVTVSIGTENSAESITLSKDRPLPPIGSLKRYVLHKNISKQKLKNLIAQSNHSRFGTVCGGGSV
jgi:hypothetical protein